MRTARALRRGAFWCAAMCALAVPAVLRADEQPAPAATSAQAVPATPATQDARVVQYVQVQHATTLTLPSTPGSPDFKLPAYIKQQIQQELESQLSGRVHDFLTGVLRSALSRASPIVGFLADTVASNLENKVLNKVLPAANMPEVKTKEISITSTTTISPDRTRVDYKRVSIIAQCDTGKMITLENDDKTFFVTTLDANNALIPPAVSGRAAHMQIHVDYAPDARTETIAGLLAHHEVETLTATGIDMPKATQERWYATSDLANACGGNGERMNGFVEIPLRLVDKIDPSTLPVTLPSMPGLDLSKLFTTQIETTSVKTIAYDPQFFDVPPGYTQVDPPGQVTRTTPSPAPQPSHR